MSYRSILIPTKSPKTWAELDGYDAEQLAAHILAAAYFPPLASDSKKLSKEKVQKRNANKRTRAVRALVAHEFGSRLDAMMHTITAETLSPDRFRTEFAHWARIWRPNWISALQRAPTLRHIDKIVPENQWHDMCILYLIAVAKIRLRHAGREDTLRRSTHFLMEVRKAHGLKGPKVSYIENLISDGKTVWHIVCALVHLWGELHRTASTEDRLSMHGLVEGEPPTSRGLINIIIDDPGRFFATCEFFLDQLSAASKVKQQHQPPVDPNQCLALPKFKDLSDIFVPSEALCAMESNEALIAAKPYYYTDYKVSHGMRRQHCT